MRSICSKCSYLLICDALHKDSTVECEDFKSNIITNADRIRAMSDEELAEFLYNVWKEQDTFSKEVCGRCGDTDVGCQPNCWLSWLRQEE